MTIPPDILGWVVVVLAAVVVVLTVGILVVALRLRGLRRSYDAVLEPERGEDLFDVLRTYRDEVGTIREDLVVVHENTEHLRELLRGTVSRVGVVRYNAFDDMGGALSFSAALLDERGDGVVVSAINGRTDTRTYAKPVSDRRSEHHLTPEEDEAIDAAMSGRREEVSSRRRRRRAAS